MQCKDELGVTMFGQMKCTWLSCFQRRAACQRICLTGTNKQLWGAWKGPKLRPSPLSRLPASAIKVRQSFALARLHLWRFAPPRLLARSYLPPRPSCLLVPPPGVCHSSVSSFINAHPTSDLPATAEAGREPSEWKWWPLCPSFRPSCEGWRTREVLSDRCVALKRASPTWRMCHFLSTTEIHRFLSHDWVLTNFVRSADLSKANRLQRLFLWLDVNVLYVCIFKYLKRGIIFYYNFRRTGITKAADMPSHSGQM